MRPKASLRHRHPLERQYPYQRFCLAGLAGGAEGGLASGPALPASSQPSGPLPRRESRVRDRIEVRHAR
jgi:hypothetical protein